MKQELAEMPSEQPLQSTQPFTPDEPKALAAIVPPLNQTAILLDIDGTLLDFAPTPREVWVPEGLTTTLRGLMARTSGALAMVSGRSLNDIDLIFAPDLFPAVGGHGGEMRLSTDGEAVASHAPPMDKELKMRLAGGARLSPGRF